MVGSLPGGQAVGVGRVEREIVTAVLEGKTAALGDDPGAKAPGRWQRSVERKLKVVMRVRESLQPFVHGNRIIPVTIHVSGVAATSQWPARVSSERVMLRDARHLGCAHSSMLPEA